MPVHAMTTHTMPTDAVPTDAMPTDAMPTDAMPTDAMTAGVCPGLAPDPALPARDELLQPALVADLLSASLGDGRLDVSGAELVRVKYRIGESLLVLDRLNVAGRIDFV